MMKKILCTVTFIVLAIYSTLAMSSQNSAGVGMEISQQDNHFVVTGMIDDGPAQEAGIQTGDVIYQVNGEPVDNLTLEEVVSKIKGESGTNVSIVLHRGSDEQSQQELTISVNRQYVFSPTDTPLIKTNPPTNSIQKSQALPSVNNSINSILYFVPLSAKVTEGMDFPLNIYLNNPKGVMCDELCLFIKYDPKALQLQLSGPGLWIELNPKLFAHWKIETISYDSTLGELSLKAHNRKPDIPLSGAIGTMLFTAGGKVPYSQVSFEFREVSQGISTRVQSKGKDILGLESESKDGVISASVRIVSQSPK
mgnify:CR=1 FL=1